MKANITLMILLLSLTLLAKEKVNPITLYATGEIHAAIEESSLENRGGISGMSHFLKKIFLTTDLLCDAGGFSAGGLYDFGTSGRSADSLRTEIICSQISQLNYTAITPGDDDLAWGAENIIKWRKQYSLPLVSANVSFSEAGKLNPSIYLKDKNIFITGVTTAKPLAPQPSDVIVSPPVESLKEIIKNAPKDAAIILLAHLTPEELDSVLIHYPQIDIVLRGHRQVSDNPLENVHGRPVLSFGFEGTQIISATIDNTIKNLKANSIDAKPFEYHLKESNEVFDLIIMSGCPYAYSAIDEFLSFQDKSDAFEWNLWFSGTIEKDNLLPGLSAGDLNWEYTVLAVQQLYPKLFHDFLWLLVQDGYTLARCLEEMNLSQEKLNRWIESEGKDLLRLHYRRSDRLNVASSPTLFINNRFYNGDVNSNRFLFELCNRKLEKGAVCNSFGECLTDSDCKSSEEIARCEGDSSAKKCVTYQDPAFNIIQILPADSSYGEKNSFTETTNELFPQAAITTLRHTNPEAVEIIEKFRIKTLPFYLIDSTITQSHNYSLVKEGIERNQNYFSFKSGFMTGSFFLTRKVIPNDTKLFVDVESNLYPIIKESNTLFPYFSNEFLSNSDRVIEILKEHNINQSPEEYFNKYIKDITVGTPVFILENNNQIREIHSQAEFNDFLEKDNK